MSLHFTKFNKLKKNLFIALQSVVETTLLPRITFPLSSFFSSSYSSLYHSLNHPPSPFLLVPMWCSSSFSKEQTQQDLDPVWLKRIYTSCFGFCWSVWINQSKALSFDLLRISLSDFGQSTLLIWFLVLQLYMSKEMQSEYIQRLCKNYSSLDCWRDSVLTGWCLRDTFWEKKIINWFTHWKLFWMLILRQGLC